ncbi:uncharacterized protein LOC101242551 isoform X1 [Ciona intestinalis]
MRARLLKDKEAYVKWERSQHERKKRMEEGRSKEEGRRREIEMRKKKQVEEEKKRAEEIVARTDQQVAVVMRQKRNASVDRTKRWSWGVGGCSSGGWHAGHAGPVCATSVRTAPSPSRYFDVNQPRVTKTRTRPVSMDISNFDVNKYIGDGDGKATNINDSPTTGNPQPENRFSRSPLVLSTTHMAFASGLRSYDTSPSNKQQSTTRARRARSIDAKSPSLGKYERDNRPNTRGRSPAQRSYIGTPPPQLTEPSPISPRLLAPTQASRARSRTNEQDDSLDSKERPTSAKSDTSVSSSRSHETKKKKTTTRTPSPAMRNKVEPVQNKSPVTSSRSRGVSPKPSRTTRSSSPALERTTNERKKTPMREKPHVGRSTPPTIKQSLRPDVLGRKLKTSPVVKSPKGIPPDGIVKKQRNKKVDSPIGRGVNKKVKLK